MSEMRERVARVMFANSSHHRERDPNEIVYLTTRYKFRRDTGNTSTSEVIRGPAWKEFELVARSAIEAMREPTFDPEAVSYHDGMTRADWWRAMIDAALVSERGTEE